VLFLNLGGILSLELEVEPNWKLEINLNCSTLMLTFQSVKDLDINLWSIESSITWVKHPWLSKLI
jgi:hypothetical protein